MNVAVGEARKDEVAFRVDHFRIFRSQLHNIGVATHGHDAFSTDCERFAPRLFRIQGVDLSV